jgi:NDP-sugar pyrophosphorylase family protein
MGGLGSRFSSEGYLYPKPLIDVEGVPMFEQSLSSFESVKSSVSLFAVVRAEHEEKFGLARHLEATGAKVKVFHGNTLGAAETALLGMELLDRDTPLVIVDCDIRFSSPALLKDILRDPPPFVGALTYFQSSNKNYSFAEIDSNGVVVRTAEKRVISSNALIGCYAFSKASVFEKIASQQLHRGLPPGAKEHYMSEVFNGLIENGDLVRSYPGHVFSFGTPGELNTYLSRN